jgi:acetyl esterase
MTMSSASYAETTDGMTITPATMRYFIDHYVPHPDDRNDWRASSLQAASLGGAPPAFLLTCGHDPLCDEGRLYASRLEQEDVPVTALHLSDQTHGMLTLSKMIEAFQPTLAYAAATLIDGWRTAPSRTVVARRV